MSLIKTAFAVLFFWFLFLYLPLPASAQVANTYTPRPVAQFAPGQERECELHWLEDLDTLREWQQEYHYWRGRYNAYAEVLGLGVEFDPGNPTLNSYPVSKDLPQQDVDNKTFSTLIESCNAHVAAAHATEDQFAYVTWLMRLFTCHARATALGGWCASEFNALFPLEFIDRLK